MHPHNQGYRKNKGKFVPKRIEPWLKTGSTNILIVFWNKDYIYELNINLALKHQISETTRTVVQANRQFSVDLEILKVGKIVIGMTAVLN